MQKNAGSPAENTAYIKDTFVKEESLGSGQTLSVDSLGKVLTSRLRVYFKNVRHIVLWCFIGLK